MKLLLEFNFFSLFLQFFYLLTLNFFKSEFCFIFRTLKEFGVVDFIYFKISCIVINSIFPIVVLRVISLENENLVTNKFETCTARSLLNHGKKIEFTYFDLNIIMFTERRIIQTSRRKFSSFCDQFFRRMSPPLINNS